MDRPRANSRSSAAAYAQDRFLAAARIMDNARLEAALSANAPGGLSRSRSMVDPPLVSGITSTTGPDRRSGLFIQPTISSAFFCPSGALNNGQPSLHAHPHSPGPPPAAGAHVWPYRNRPPAIIPHRHPWLTSLDHQAGSPAWNLKPELARGAAQSQFRRLPKRRKSSKATARWFRSMKADVHLRQLPAARGPAESLARSPWPMAGAPDPAPMGRRTQGFGAKSLEGNGGRPARCSASSVSRQGLSGVLDFRRLRSFPAPEGRDEVSERARLAEAFAKGRLARR